MNGLALIIGSGGIGKQLAEDLDKREKELDVVLCGRKNNFPSFWELDIENDNSLENLKHKIYDHSKRLRIVINATGRLHSETLIPEKRLQHLERKNLLESFSINSIAPILLAKTIEEFIPRDSIFNFASISARVGSIEDNNTGGWYSYRAAKSAQNQLLKSLSIEWARKFPYAIISLLHPGTVNTNLSKPFQRFVPQNKLFSKEKSSKILIDLLNKQTPSNSGQFLAWDGSQIPW
ncbi:MAG: short-chain dehydrogenase [Prochlorococcus sp. SP3034]|nr:short-chain dehydrogenase [Prochlorococcus sp. SP3034]|tara:strand:+ start:2302 stop:3006 length:705 start_codon:yes stop_codon:yes gene_type:complete